MYLALLSREHFIWILGSLCQAHRLRFDSIAVLRQFPAPHTVGQLIEAVRTLEFRTGVCDLGRTALSRMSFPCVGFLQAAARATADREAPPHTGQRHPLTPVMLVKTDGQRVLFFSPDADEPETIPSEDLGNRLESFCILLRQESSPTSLSDDGVTNARTPFGFRWFVAELLKHKRIGRDVVLASFFIQLIALATPLFTQVVIDKVVVHQTQSTLIAVVLGLTMFMVFNAGITWLRQYLLLHTGNRIDAVLGSEVFRHLLNVVLPYFEHRPTGTLVARLHAVETIREFLTGATMAVLLDLPFLIIFMAIMFAYSWELTLIALGMLGLLATVSLVVAPLLRSRVNRQFLLGARNQAFVTEYVSGIETVKSLQMEPRLRARYDGLLADYVAAGFATRQVSNTYSVVANALEQGMIIALLCVGALLVMRNDGFTIGMLVAFQMFAARMSQPMLRLAALWQEFQQANIAVKRLADIMDAPAEPHTTLTSANAAGAGEVRVRDISFRYSPQHPYLYRGLNLTLQPGKLIVVTGPSGCGKSTLAKMLLGFYFPDDGHIFIDGRDLRNLPANELRQNFGVVPQETCLFSGSIYENVISASPDAGFADAVRACRIAEIHEFIESLPQGYNTVVGEHGVGLSGGQKQRIAIARAVLKRPRILIFDEATSNLDQQTAEQFARTVNQLKGKVTMLFIAHQVPRGLAVDEVVKLEGYTRQDSAEHQPEEVDHA